MEAEKGCFSAIKCPYLENLHNTTKIVYVPLEMGSCSIKSIVITCQA
uniref:Uncharacterized protein n=1 Tax=Manihot esculenta TaxID=3983 RepID=A0A2C9WG41_MANES